ncbi:MAG: hypothetical protein ABFS38_17380 [Bacteroidota bacterium]
MKNRLWIPVIALLLLTSIDGYGQRWKLRRYEADLYIGAVTFHGDIGLANKPVMNNFNGMRPSVGFKPSFKIMEDFAVALDLAYVIYAGQDEEGSSHGRLYSFNSHAFQHVARAEYYIIGDGRKFISGAMYNRKGMVNNYNKLYLYVFGGVGGVLSKSTVKDLRNNGEEPLSNPGYDNTMQYTAVFPVGGGVKWSIDPRWSIGVEMGYQYTLSDYLDGYSSAWSEYNDSYYLTTVKAIYKIRNDRNGRPVFKRLYR